MNKILICMVLVFLVSCKTVRVNQQTQRTTQTAVELGSIGLLSKGFQQDRFQTNTLPNYKQKLRVTGNITTFTEDTFGAFTKAVTQQNKELKIWATKQL